MSHLDSSSQTISDSLQTWRESIIQGILYAMLGLGALAMVSTSIDILMHIEERSGTFPLFRIAFYILAYGFVVYTTFVRRLPFAIRAGTPLVLLYFIGLTEFYLFGNSWEGFVLFFVVIALATLLFGIRHGIVVLGISIGIQVIVALATIRVGFHLPFENLVHQRSGLKFDDVLVFLFLVSIVIIPSTYLIRGLQKSLRQAAEATAALEIANDVLEHRVAERTAELAAAVKEAERARAAAEKASDFKTKFLANMSHELRTPLNSIINFTRIVSSGMRGPVTDEQVEYLNRVRFSGEHLLGLINDILDIAKIEAGRMELYPETCNLADLVQSTMATATGLVKGKPIELYEEIPPDLPLVEIDKTRIRQVLLNLLSNAAKFTDEGNITVRISQQDHELLIQVSDTGIGIPSDKLATVFEEFRQAHEGTDRSYQGTGLGLPICSKLVEMHNGRIGVESTDGNGSTFWFTLPIVNSKPACSPVSLPEQTTSDGVPVLVIDDDSAVVEIITSYLEPHGYHVVGLTDNQYSLDAVQTINPAVIILDVLMPHKDGWSILAELKANLPTSQIPVMFYTIMEQKGLGLHLGASAYLFKPIDEQLLRTTVEQLAGHAETILVIDDDANVRTILHEQLGQTGSYRITLAHGGQAGLDAIAASLPDLIILDLMMPDVDGFTVLAHLDREPATQAIPVIVLTAKELTNEEREYLRHRVTGLMDKHETVPEKMLQMVQGVVERRGNGR